MKKINYTVLLLACSITAVTSYASPRIQTLIPKLTQNASRRLLTSNTTKNATEKIPGAIEKTPYSDAICSVVLAGGVVSGIEIIEPLYMFGLFCDIFGGRLGAEFSLPALPVLGIAHILSGGKKLLEPNKIKRIPGRIGTAVLLSAGGLMVWYAGYLNQQHKSQIEHPFHYRAQKD